MTATTQIFSKSLRIHGAAKLISPLILNTEPITRAVLNTAMARAFGLGNASGSWSQRDSFDMAEAALVMSLLTLCDQGIALTPELLDGFSRNLPTQTVRSEEQIDFQQFSTPVGLAWLVGQAAMITASDTCLEPSAGTGLLAVVAYQAGARLLLNEYAPLRHGLLRLIFPAATLTAHDGAYIDTALGTDNHARPSVVLMNPPFVKSGGGHDDRFAAVRHLRAALRALLPGGRLVAVMPDWFTRTKMERVFDETFAGTSLHAIWRIGENGFAKHGTGTRTQVFILDKVAGTGQAIITQRPQLADFAGLLSAIPPRAIAAALPKPAPRRVPPLSGTARTLFAGFTKTVRASKPLEARPDMAILPVAYRTLAEPAALEAQVGIYLPYRPSRIVFESAGEHPTQLVESIAMGSIPAPIPTYQPALPANVVEARVLSAAQLETIVYAGDAHASFLPGLYVLPPKGLELVADKEGQSYRQGFFLGDGTGAGKGRQLAGIILDQWLKGNTRHIWISDNNPLLEDARRDWSALGGIPLDIVPLTDWKVGQTITLTQGILFLSYPTLRSQTSDHSRLQQILAWAGPDFDGVIIFDEAHAMGGVAGGEGSFGKPKGSAQGIAGVTLQHSLPKARIVYSSATGASDINNLSYAVRLGLWGAHTAFSSREGFITEIRKGGIAAMELVARELKGLGLYCARALSYAGVEYDILEHALTPAQISDFDTYADAWGHIHRHLEDALALTNVTDPIEGKTLNPGALGAARSRFESCKQRFFGQLLLSMKLPSLLPAISAARGAGHSVVVQLVTTAEAMLDRRLADLGPEDRAELCVDLSPREHMTDYLLNAFPVRQMEIFYDDDGHEHSRPMFDDDGNPVLSPQALQMRGDLIEMLCAMPPITSALDAIITHFGAPHVAEITGRTRRLLTTPDGKQTLDTRSPRSNIAETQRFMSGEKHILVFSDAGGTGRSYHASLDCANQTRRVHFLLEPGWRADKAIQGLGRTNRTHQACAPIFRPVTTNCRGERRFISTIARRLDTLGALTRGQRQTGGQNLFNPADNLESDYAKDALIGWIKLLHQGKLASTSFADFVHRTGLKLEHEGMLVDNLPPIQRWLNRILALPIAVQNAIFDEFMGLVETRVEAARAAGTLDVGVETLRADQLRLIEDRVLRTDPRTGATSNLLTIEAAWKKEVRNLAEIRELASRHGRGAVMLWNDRSKAVALQIPRHNRLLNDGTSVRQYTLMRPCGHSIVSATELAESHWAPMSRAAFMREWEAAVGVAQTDLSRETLFIATGQLLPIWNKLDSDSLEVRRITTDDGQSILGRIVPAAHINKLCQALGLDTRIELDPATILQSLRDGRSLILGGDQPLTIKRARVNQEWRIELVGADPHRLAHYKSLGCFTEIIAHKTRLFVPADRAGGIIAVLQS